MRGTEGGASWKADQGDRPKSVPPPAALAARRAFRPMRRPTDMSQDLKSSGALLFDQDIAFELNAGRRVNQTPRDEFDRDNGDKNDQ